MKKIISILISLMLMLPVLSGCGGGGEKGGNAVKIRVDLHGWTPTVNETSSSGSVAYNSPKYIAREFEALHDNKVKIEWVRDKNLQMTEDQAAQYFANALANNNTPSIAFSWGTVFQDRGWYVDLTPYLEEQNSYETATDLAGKKWKESFEDYLFTLNSIKTYDDKIVAVPLTLFAGSAPAVLYNTNLVQQLGYTDVADPKTLDQYELGIEAPFNWTTYQNLVDDAMSAYDDNALVDSTCYPPTSNSWLMQFHLGPAYMAYAESFVDTDNDGFISGKEMLKGVIDGQFDPSTKPYAKELLDEIKLYMGKLSDKNVDATLWEAGNGVLQHNGSWVYTPEKNNNRPYNWEMVPAPMHDGGDYAKVEWVDFADAQPGTDLYVNIMKGGVTKDGTLDGEIDEDKLYYSVEFLKYLTTREANSAMIDEMNTSIGAVKGADLPQWLSNTAYTRCKFGKASSYSWPTGFTTERRVQLDIALVDWIQGRYTGGDAAFYKYWNDINVAGAKDIANKLGIDLTK